MTTVPTHLCTSDQYEVCTCGRPGWAAFSPTTRLAPVIESVFEFVEAADDDDLFTIWRVAEAAGGRLTRHYSVALKALRLMEQHGYVERVPRPDGFTRPILWRRAAPLAAAS